MKFVRYQMQNAGERLGILNEEESWVYPLTAFGMEYETMEDLIKKISREDMQRLSVFIALPIR